MSSPGVVDHSVEVVITNPAVLGTPRGAWSLAGRRGHKRLLNYNGTTEEEGVPVKVSNEQSQPAPAAQLDRERTAPPRLLPSIQAPHLDHRVRGPWRSARHLQEVTCVSIKRIVQTLRAVRSATIEVDGQTTHSRPSRPSCRTLGRRPTLEGLDPHHPEPITASRSHPPQVSRALLRRHAARRECRPVAQILSSAGRMETRRVYFTIRFVETPSNAVHPLDPGCP